MKTFFIFLFIFSFLKLYSQEISTSISNTLRYGSGFERIGEASQIEYRKEYFENFLDTRIFSKNFTIGFRLDMYQQPEYGIPFRGLKKRYVEFTKNKISIRAGNFNAMFSKGLSLNIFENKSLAFDTQIDGIKSEFKSKTFDATILGGEIDFVEPITIKDLPPLREEKYSIRAINTELKPLKEFSFGGSFVWAKGKHPNFFQTQDSSITQVGEIFSELRNKNVDFNINYLKKFSKINSIDISNGYAIYSSLSYSSGQFGMTIEYKNYAFDIVDYLTRISTQPPMSYRNTRMLPFQNPPIVHKEHSFTLLSRYPHIVDFNDEVGFQLDIFYALNNKTNLSFNSSLSSRHFGDFVNSNFVASKKEIGKIFLPSFENSRSPFSELYFDIEHFYDEANSYIKIAVNKRSEITYDANPFQIYKSPKLTTITLPFVLNHSFSDITAVKFAIENQWYQKKDDKYFNQLSSLQITNANFSCGIRYERTTNKYEIEGKQNWVIAECAYRFGSEHSLSLSYGEERGGQVCSNGICRTVSPYSGLRMSLTSQF